MNWYYAKLITECVTLGSTASSLVDEQILIVPAPDPETAYAMAYEIGESTNNESLNEYDEPVAWIFRGLSDLRVLTEAERQTGTEITSRLYQRTGSAPLVPAKEDLPAFRSEQGNGKITPIPPPKTFWAVPGRAHHRHCQKWA